MISGDSFQVFFPLIYGTRQSSLNVMYGTYVFDPANKSEYIVTMNMDLNETQSAISPDLNGPQSASTSLSSLEWQESNIMECEDI